MHVPARDRVLKTIAATITIFFCGLLSVLLFSIPGLSAAIDWHDIGDYELDIIWSEAVVHDDYIYVAGGKIDDKNPTNIVRYAKIQPNGALGTWQNDAPPLPNKRYLHAMVADENYLYLLGGWNSESTTIYQDVWRARFLEDGKLGGWDRIGELHDPLYIHDAVIARGYIFVIGGYGGLSGDETFRSVYSAKITDDGIGDWNDAGALDDERRAHAATVHNDRIYVTGGLNANEQSQKTVYMAEVQEDGTLSEWNTLRNLEHDTHYHQAVIHDDRLVIMGGTERVPDPSYYADVYAAPIRDDGTLDDWVPQSSFNTGMSSFAAVPSVRSNSEFIYTIGGFTGLEVIRTVLLSAPVGVVPPTPIPPGLNLSMVNDPQGWPAPGEEITYTIEYENPGVSAISDVQLQSWIPENTELVADSITAGSSDEFSFEGFQPNDAITWSFSDIGAEESDSVSYRVLRPLQPTSSSDSVEISKQGPAAVEPGDLITYTLTITNTLANDIQNLVVEDLLPRRATYVRGGVLDDDGYVRWAIPVLPGLESTTVEFVVTATQTLINSDYRVRYEILRPTIGHDIVITWVGDTPLPPEGDGTVITNQGASATWFYAGQQNSTASNAMNNPSFSIYMPTVSR